MRIYILLFLTTISQFCYSQLNKSNSEISAVTVFLEGAEILRKSQIDLTTGHNTIEFYGLSDKIHEKSIQINTQADIRILTISTSKEINRYYKDSLTLYQDSSKYFLDAIRLGDNRVGNLKKEQTLLDVNANRIGTNGGVLVPELEKATQFYRQKQEQLSSDILKEQNSLEQLKTTKRRIDKIKLHYAKRYHERKTKITVNLIAAKTETSDFSISYVVSEANWYPIYNIRASNTDEPITLEYNAQISNRTNTDWNNVDLHLSTAEPFESLIQPLMEPWYLDFRRTQNDGYAAQQYKKSEVTRSSPAEVAAIPEEDIGNTNYTNTISVDDVSIKFHIDGKQQIPSDDKTHFIEVKKDTLLANYKYYAVPKVEPSAFLLAHVYNWQDLKLLSAKANIFYADNFIGETFIELNASVDTLKISLGRDPNIIIERGKLKDFTSKKLIGANKKEAFAYEISVKNMHKNNIEIEVVDQLPISSHNEIEVTVEEISNASHDLSTGKLTWTIELKPQETKRVSLAFTVKYPKNKKVNVSRSKNISAPARFW